MRLGSGISLLVPAAAWCVAAAVFGQEAELPLYVGKGVCLECHVEGDRRGSCLVEPIEGHEKSYGFLLQPEASDIAWLSGVPEAPTESRVCLGCHATSADAGARWRAETFNITDGVQCEKCHGAGSLHVAAARGLEEGAAYGAAGGVALVKRLIDPGERVACTSCHRERESHRMVRESAYWKETADGYYKTPVKLAVSPDGERLYVACEQGDGVIVVDAVERRVIREVKVGSQPHDVAVSRDGRRVYVTNRMSDSLSVIDAESLKVVREASVGDEPHGVRLNAEGDLLFVLNTGEDTVSVLAAGTLREKWRLPAGRGPWSMALSPDGARLAVTSVRPTLGRFQDQHTAEVTLIDARTGRVADRVAVAGANMMHDVNYLPDGRAVLFTLMRSKNLVPITRMMQGWVITNGLGILWPDGHVDQVLLDEEDDYFPDANGVAVSPDGAWAVVTSGGSDRVAVIDVGRLLEMVTRASDDPFGGGRGSVGAWPSREVLPNLLGTRGRFVVKLLDVGANPRGVVFSPSGEFAYVANALDDTVSVIDAGTWEVVATIDLGGPGKLTAVRWGERLFHSADNAFGTQYSCRSCHPDGHVNGLTFDIEADGVGLSPVDNRTLRGIVDTNPFKWEGTNPSLSRQCGPRLAVYFTRLEPYGPAELDAVTRYMCTIARPPNRYREADGLTDSQRRGKAIFERRFDHRGQLIAAERRCHTCHGGAYTNSVQPRNVGSTMWLDLPVDVRIEDLHATGEVGDLGMVYFHDTGGSIREFDVPHLTNIYEGGPFLHNGSAATLEEVWTRFNPYDTHGVTTDMTRGQFNDLMAYLKAL